MVQPDSTPGSTAPVWQSIALYNTEKVNAVKSVCCECLDGTSLDRAVPDRLDTQVVHGLWEQVDLETFAAPSSS